MEILLIFWFICGLIAGYIYQNKGRSSATGFIGGLLLGPLGIVLALITPEDKSEIEKKQNETELEKVSRGEMKKCPYCAEIIKSEALICKHCRRDLPKNLEIHQDVKYWGNKFATVLNWNEPIRENTARVLKSLKHPFDEKTKIVFIVYKDTKKFHIYDVRINEKSLNAKNFCIIATPDKLIFLDLNNLLVFDYPYENIVSIASEKMFNTIIFTLQMQARTKLVFNFEASNNVTEKELNQFRQLLISFFDFVLREKSLETQKSQLSQREVTQTASNANFRNELLEAELAISSGDKKTAALIIDKILRYDFVNQAAWQLLYQLLGNGMEFSSFQKEFALKYYPDKLYLLSKQ